jgi:hypothetical protein
MREFKSVFYNVWERSVSSGERLYRISGEGLVGWNLLIPANQAIRISGSVRP